jgi:hypothetical protein
VQAPLFNTCGTVTVFPHSSIFHPTEDWKQIQGNPGSHVLFLELMLWQSAKAFAAKREMESPRTFRVQNDNLNGENDDKPLGCGVPY